jgi:hypothetical protein
MIYGFIDIALWQTFACSNIIHYLKRRRKYNGDLREDQEFIGRKNTMSKYEICGIRKNICVYISQMFQKFGLSVFFFFKEK